VSADRSAAAPTVSVVWPRANPVAKKIKLILRELDKERLIFNNESVLRAAGSEIRRSAEAKTLT
jgi:hypothetical protein